MRDLEAEAKVFKAFSDANRLKILELLKSGEQCSCVLLSDLKIGQSTLSYHMKMLVAAGVVTGREEGKWTYYRINEVGVQNAIQLMLRASGMAIFALGYAPVRNTDQGTGCEQPRLVMSGICSQSDVMAEDSTAASAPAPAESATAAPAAEDAVADAAAAEALAPEPKRKVRCSCRHKK